MGALTQTPAKPRRGYRRPAYPLRWLRVVTKYAFHKYRLAIKGVPVGRSGLGPEGPNAGTHKLGVPIPVKPSPSHHLVGAKEFPPSDRTHSYPKD